MFETSGSRVGVVGPVFVDAILGTGVAMDTELVPEDVAPNSALVPGPCSRFTGEFMQHIASEGLFNWFYTEIQIICDGGCVCRISGRDFFGSSVYSVEPEQGTELYEYEPSIARDSEREQAAQVDSESEPQGVVSCD